MSADVRYCNQCFAYLSPGNIPKSHANHAKDHNAVSSYCPKCHEVLWDSRSASEGHIRHLQQEAKLREPNIQKALNKIEQQGTKIIDKGNFIMLKEGLGVVAEEELVHKLAARKDRK